MAGKKLSETKNNPTGNLMFKQVPVALRRKFRAWCELRHISMREKILDMIRECVKIKEIHAGDSVKEVEETGKKTYMLIDKVPQGLRCHFKAWCTLRGVTIQDKLISLMRECVKDSKGGL